MGGQVQSQLVNGKIQCHQLQQRAVNLREAGAQLLVERQIQAGKERALTPGGYKWLCDPWPWDVKGE